MKQDATMKMTQLNLDGTPVEPETDPRGRHLHGRPPGAKGVVTEYRHAEVARLAVLGEPINAIAEQLGVGTTRAGQLVREAEELGITDELAEARSARVKEMSEKRYELAKVATDIVQARLDEIKADIDRFGSDTLDARAINDAFRALDRTEYTVDGAVKIRESEKPKQPIGMLGNQVHIEKVAIFPPEAIKAAQADSERVYGR